ncbi:hypothetical protein [uncultured Tateyamaria sp.]|uniref:hypothetical protein n=1 Tax=uncultured Tateyamaria sp. TaxID=455651 RepID=UPI0026294D02|nr:hypothetical protein [uncultured Tateyamaria sp.]
MSVSHQQFLERLAHAFCAGHLGQVAEHFVYPMPYYSDHGLVVFGSTGTLSEGLALYHQACKANGVDRITPRIVAEGMTIRGYSNVWVEWDHFDHAGVCMRTSQVRYVLFQETGALFPKIEMVDYTVQAFPEVNDDMPAMATA